MIKSEWRVKRNPMMPEGKKYSAYRLLDVQKVMHSGNIEEDFANYATKAEAEARAAQLNKEEAEK